MPGEHRPAVADRNDMVNGVGWRDPPHCLAAPAKGFPLQVCLAKPLPGHRVVGELSH